MVLFLMRTTQGGSTTWRNTFRMPSLSLMCVISSSKIAGEAREADLSAGDPNSTWEDDGLSSVDVVIFTV